MPGLALAAGLADGAAAGSPLGAHPPSDYRSTVFVDVPGRITVGFAAPLAYPVTVERAAGVTCVLEGAVYAAAGRDLAADLRTLAESFARDPARARDDAEAWAAKADGDFVLCLADDAGAAALVVNDRLGRLPLYCARAPGRAAVAREIKSVRAVAGNGEIDRIALSQLLLFSFPLGTRTLHGNVERLPEASSVALDASGGMDVRRYYRWNFESLAEGGSHLATPAEQLADLFVDRCAAQARFAGARPLVVAMSGGLDSRAAAAGLRRAGAQFACVTFESGRKGASEESATAERVAKTLGAPWRRYDLARPSWEAMRRLASRCDGTTNVGMAFMDEFFARFHADFGPDAVQVTGDGGDRALPDLSDRLPSKDRHAFVTRQLEGALFPVDAVAGLVRLDAREIVDAVRAHVDAYPERSPAWWTVRFTIADWGWGRIFSGEDRSRSYAWTMTPFYCQSFFEAAMRVPAHVKRDYALYARFLRRLDPQVAALKKSNWGYAPTSPLVRLRGVTAALHAAIPPALRKSFGAFGASKKREANAARTRDPEFLAALQGGADPAFDTDALAEVARRGCGKTQYHMILTAMLYAEQVWR